MQNPDERDIKGAVPMMMTIVEIGFSEGSRAAIALRVLAFSLSVSLDPEKEEMGRLFPAVVC